MARPDPLAVSLVEAAFELHRRRLWLEVPVDAPFLVRVPGEEHPVVATVIGHDGSEYGLVLTRGEQGFRQIASTFLEGRDREEDFEAHNHLAMTIDTLADIEPDLRGVMSAAGFQARRESLAPCIFCKPPYRSPRTPNRSEMRLMLACLRGLFALHDAGELHPISLDGQKQSVFQIVVEGEGRKATARAEIVPWPSSSSPREVEVFADLREIDRDLPRLDASWIVAFVLLPGGKFGDERNFGASFVVEIGTHEILSTDVLPPGEPRAVAAQLAELLGTGLPQEIIFANADVHEALALDIAALGIRATLDPDNADLAELMEMLGVKLDAIAEAAAQESGATGSGVSEEGATETAPATLAEWRALDRALTERLVREVEASRLFHPRSLARFFGSEKIAREVCRELDRLQPMVSLMEWLITDYRATKKSATVLERRLKDAATTPIERTLIEARMNTRLSIYRVDAAEPGATLDVEDIFDGKRFTIHDRSLSGCGVEGLFIPMRITQFGEWTVTGLAGPPLTHLQIDRALALLESLGVELSPEGLRRSSHLVGRLWKLLLEREQRAPKLVNTDGEPLVWHTATFRVADGAALARALGKRPDVEYDEGEGVWVWSRPGGPAPGFGEITLLARLEMMDDRLVVEVNSAGRLARVRQWIEALPGVSFERATARELTSKSQPVDDKLEERPAPVGPEMLRAVEEMHRKYLRSWVDQPVPALGGVTPRQACQTAEGRRRVERLVRTMPAVTYPGGTLPPAREELLRELGLGR